MPLRLVKKGKIFHITGTIAGQRVRESTGTDSKEHAEIARAKREREALDRHFLGPDKTATFAEAVILYLESGGDGKFMTPILDWFGMHKLRDITQSEILRFAADAYPGVTAASMNRLVFTPIIATLRFAAKAGLCSLPALQRPKQGKRKAVSYAKQDWLDAFFAAAKSNMPLTGIVLFLTTTAARVSEACNLKWDDVSLAKGTALLRSTKNGEPRVVRLAPAMIEILNSLPQASGSLVFGYAGRWSVNQAIERVCHRCGLSYLSSHKVGRHAFSARLLGEGHTTKMVAEAGGWKSHRMVDEVYGHLQESHVTGAVERANAAVGAHISLNEIAGYPEVPTGSCGVYVVSTGGYYKIGRTTNMANRMTGLQAATPLRVIFHHIEVMTAVAASEVERLSHGALQQYHTQGEWFACSLEAAMLALTQACAHVAASQIGISVAHEPVSDHSSAAEITTYNPNIVH